MFSRETQFVNGSLRCLRRLSGEVSSRGLRLSAIFPDLVRVIVEECVVEPLWRELVNLRGNVKIGKMKVGFEKVGDSEALCLLEEQGQCSRRLNFLL
jgi:hypothetical protein